MEHRLMIDDAYLDGWRAAENQNWFQPTIYGNPKNQEAYKLGYDDAEGTIEILQIEIDDDDEDFDIESV